jgi:hypothetical protein
LGRKRRPAKVKEHPGSWREGFSRVETASTKALSKKTLGVLEE